MVVEHVFITTLESADALRLASQFLGGRGFQAEAQVAFAMGSGDAWNVLEMKRGKKNPARAKSVVELPQQVRLEWDRGRVTVAASSTSVHESRATTMGRRAGRRVARAQEALLTALVRNLQELLEAQQDPETVLTACTHHEDRIHADERARRRRNTWIGLSILFVIIALIVGIAVLANRDH